MSNLKEMNIPELKKYLSDNRNNDEIFSEALGELISRNPNRKRYPADMTFEEIGQVIGEKLDQIKQESS